MIWLYILGAIILAAVIAVAVLRQRVNSESIRLASDMAKDIFPVWAMLGPFKNGTESAVAMGYAFLVVQGSDTTVEKFDAIKRHVMAYDADPEAWEENRQIALEKATPNVSAHVKQALQLCNGTADRDDEKTITAVVIESMLKGNRDKLADYILDKRK